MLQTNAASPKHSESKKKKKKVLANSIFISAAVIKIAVAECWTQIIGG